MKTFFITLLYRMALIGLLGMALSISVSANAVAEEAAPPAKTEAGAKEEGNSPKGASKDEIGKGTVVQVPRRTFEGQEPLFYLNSDRRPFVEPLRKTDEESYYICRGTVGHWFRELVAQEATMLAQRNGFESVKPDLCALRLVETRTGKKRPVISVELYLNDEHMQECVLGKNCPNARSAIMFVRDKTLYRSYVIGDAKLKQVKEYCLDNRSQILANEPCWRHFASTDQAKRQSKDEPKSSTQDTLKTEEETRKSAQEADASVRKARTARREAREKGQDANKTPASSNHAH